MLLIKDGEVVRDDNKLIISGIKDLKARLKEHKNSEIKINFALIGCYMEIYAINNSGLTFIGYYSNQVKDSIEMKTFLRENNFKCHNYSAIKF